MASSCPSSITMPKRSATQASPDEGQAVSRTPRTVHSVSCHTVIPSVSHRVYLDILPKDAVTFLFSTYFSKALSGEAANVYGVSSNDAIEEFRRLLAIKAFTVDVNADKISPTPIMDQL
ncbi:hypothetical protein K491DRAFT_682473 [Lophiostoma macrostomum CBS 122681]|uniref:Uncharacterized protein n=1 Tax=Lophiostoma macrostomum CBS 122681 TaxID=1314788 RepID=A0A6A6SU54_9PLEO|nr:hypothetical protein K491DRAFT_682473 [Lophiostoma macrostomum CBS 122681]